MSETHRISPESIRKRLESVTDPELDRSVVELEYIEGIEIDGGSVEVAFTLPTAWCSPAFAWMMMVDARDALAAHPAISTATVRLRDHMHAREINEGVNAREPFGSAFEDADGDIESVRRELDEKARVARQYRAVSALLEGGLTPDQIVELVRGDVETGDDRATIRVDDTLRVCVDAAPIERYLEKATGLVCDSTDRLFLTPEGETIPPEAFETVHKRGRLATTNMGSQGHICENLGDARIGGPTVT
ncbi:hypothetical protein HAPAU_23200 [Halalkalicoccus paucihalophilus]|uniref:MIP18 family-like domain-containing protein n=1 Tax=Halalkalicoccus paucihalophilus TaxID=1008153 RepID=A0A151ADA3_9EURY|nr:iron-sulfur cluster assembly protein [Halalkalicoccus paucihalophilus]KYH25645.1 hypothetical protein HAPAU_23200 [Halalkalicoccus paucihalophilus]